MTGQTLIPTESMPETEPGETKDKGQRGQQRYRQGHRRKKKTGTEEESRQRGRGKEQILRTFIHPDSERERVPFGEREERRRTEIEAGAHTWVGGLASHSPAHAKQGFWLQGSRVGRGRGGEGSSSLMSLLAESPIVPSAPAGLFSLLSLQLARPASPWVVWSLQLQDWRPGLRDWSAGGGEGGRKALGTGTKGGARIPSAATQTPKFLSYLFLRECLSQPVIQVTELWGKGTGRKV